jgi:uncharacterized protein (TIGR02453 family)
MKNILSFLSDLASNNRREWMQENKKRFELAKKEFVGFVDQILVELQKSDPALIGIKANECIFRLNRDVRFSKDKSPYKLNFAAFISPEGKKTFGPGYYLHVQPGQSFIAGGIYMPPTEQVQKIRQEIDYNPGPLDALFSDPDFLAMFPQMEGDALVRAPKPYTEDHPKIQWLKKKSFLVSHALGDAELLAKNSMDDIANGFALMQPFNTYLRMALAE